MDNNNNGRLPMVLAGIAGLLVGFLTGWLWVDTEEVDDISGVTEDSSAINLDDLDLEDTAGTAAKEGKMATTTPSTLQAKKPVAGTKQTTTTPAPTPIVSAEGNKVTVGAQTAGNEVSIANLMLDRKSWVVIHEDESGKPSRILGAKRFERGAHEQLTVKLLRATEAGHTYYAMIHSDNGDSPFDQKTDVAVTTTDGTSVMAQFEVQ